MGRLLGHVQPRTFPDVSLEFIERLTRFREDAAPRQQRAARVPCDTPGGNATGEQASEDAATATCPDSDARGCDLTTSTSDNMFAMTSETTRPDDMLTDADAAPSSRAQETAHDEVASLDAGSVPSPSSPATSAPRGKSMMLRNLPCKLTQEELEKVIRSRGFGGRYDFVHVPSSYRTGVNIGYAFVNLVDEACAAEFKLSFDGFRFPDTLSEKVCEVQPSRLQGRVAQLSQPRKARRGGPST